MKKGFTLAEVLITLTLIGIVAAINIPTLINNIGEQQNKVAWKKTFADISQATMRIAVDNGGTLAGICTNSNIAIRSNCYRDLYARYLNYTKSCDYMATGCYHHTGNDFKQLNGNIYNSVWVNDSGLILANGTLLNMQSQAPNCNNSSDSACLLFHIDINGFKGPNTLGKDIYGGLIFETIVKPYGFQGDTRENTCNTSNSGWGCSAQYLYQ